MKNQTLPAKKNKEKRMLAFVNEKTRSCFLIFRKNPNSHFLVPPLLNYGNDI